MSMKTKIVKLSKNKQEFIKHELLQNGYTYVNIMNSPFVWDCKSNKSKSPVIFDYSTKDNGNFKLMILPVRFDFEKEMETLKIG